jgi:2-polyprenyl-6-methoxyphenol hydroxylase-like FAD-dependent oxidoreductase
VEQYDLVVVGGGVAGSTIAARMSSAGRRVLVLEQAEHFVDRVRGEYIAPWGVGEAIALDVWHVITGVPHCNPLTHFVGFEEQVPEAEALATMRDFEAIVPDVPSAVGVSHPGLSEALLDHAAACGADVRRGVAAVTIDEFVETTVRWRSNDAGFEARAPLIVASDGRASSLRRALGLELHETTATRFLAGMLVDDTDEWPRHIACHGVEGDIEYIMFPQAEGLMRVYSSWSIDDPRRLAGSDRQRRFLDALRLECTSWSAAVAGGTPAGPCSWFPMTDSWLDDPVHGPIVFAGDAAGWSNPLIGQGLSVALRDARVLTDVLLSGERLDAYRDERAERMRRLRVSMAVSDLIYDFGPEMPERRARIRAAMHADPVLAGARLTTLAGPWAFGADSYSEQSFEALVTASGTITRSTHR